MLEVNMDAREKILQIKKNKPVFKNGFLNNETGLLEAFASLFPVKFEIVNNIAVYGWTDEDTKNYFPYSAIIKCDGDGFEVWTGSIVKKYEELHYCIHALSNLYEMHE